MYFNPLQVFLLTLSAIIYASKFFFYFNLYFRAVNMITKHFGSVAASNVKTLQIERLPLIVLIYRLKGNTEIFQVRIITNCAN